MPLQAEMLLYEALARGVNNQTIAMRAVLQRVKRASVKVEDKITGAINKGILLFLGIERGDLPADAEWLVNKVAQVRIFQDKKGRMNESVIDCDGGVLLISQFTLYGSLQKGTRPSFNRAAVPEVAIPLYEDFAKQLEAVLKKPVYRGVFGAYMAIEAHHDGPVTLVLDSENKKF